MALDSQLLTNLANNEAQDCTVKSLKNHEVLILADALKHCSNLKTFHLRNCAPLGLREAKAIAEALKSCPDLHTLDFNRTTFNPGAAEAIANALLSLPNLQVLGLNAALLSTDGAKDIANALPSLPNLQVLGLNATLLGPDGAEDIANALPSLPNLHTLDLNEIQLNLRGRQHAVYALQCIRFGLKQCANLHKLSLNSYDLMWSDDNPKDKPYGTTLIHDVIRYCPNLHHIKVSGVLPGNITEAMHSFLAKLIIECKYLTTFLIQNTDNSTLPCTPAIAEALNTNQKRIKAAFEVTKLAQDYQNDAFYEKLFSCPSLTKAIEDGCVAVSHIHKFFTQQEPDQIDIFAIRNQAIINILDEHYSDPILPELLEELLAHNFYDVDVIPTILKYGHFSFAEQLIANSKGRNYTEYFAALLHAPQDQNSPEYKALVNALLDKIKDAEHNSNYMQQAIGAHDITLVKCLIAHHASSKGVNLQEGFVEDAEISTLLTAYATSEEHVTELGKIHPDEV